MSAASVATALGGTRPDEPTGVAFGGAGGPKAKRKPRQAKNEDSGPTMKLLPPQVNHNPAVEEHQNHTERSSVNQEMEYIMVAQLVNGKAKRNSKEAKAARYKEWDALMARKCWDISKAEK